MVFSHPRTIHESKNCLITQKPLCIENKQNYCHTKERFCHIRPIQTQELCEDGYFLSLEVFWPQQMWRVPAFTALPTRTEDWLDPTGFSSRLTTDCVPCLHSRYWPLTKPLSDSGAGGGEVICSQLYTGFAPNWRKFTAHKSLFPFFDLFIFFLWSYFFQFTLQVSR